MSGFLFNPRFWAIVGLVFAAVWIANWFLDVGYDRAMTTVNKQNERVVNDADLGELSEIECNARRADGERVYYDFAAGKCRWR